MLIENGLFDESLLSSQDYELWLRLSPHIRPFFIHTALGSYIDRKDNITSTNFLRRWKNQHIIAIRYRHQVKRMDFLRKLLTINASMMLSLIK